MRVHEATATTARRVLWVGGLVVVLIGLLGMHGLDNHGAEGMHTSPHAGMTAPLSAVAATGHDALSEPPALAQDGPAAYASATVAIENLPMDMGMAAKCLAVLALALLALLRRLLAKTHRPALTLDRPGRAPGHLGRDPDPPSLIHLSIQRC